MIECGQVPGRETRNPMTVSAARAKSRLTGLLDERRTALRSPLGANTTYMDDLEAEIAACRTTYVTAAVTELAVLHGAARGRPQG